MYNFEEKPFNEESGEKDLKWLSKCPLCGNHYNSGEPRIVTEENGVYLLYTTCPKCGGSIVASLSTNQLGVSSIGLVTDLTYEDVIKFKDSEEITEDCVLEAYDFLENWEGGFEELFYLE